MKTLSKIAGGFVLAGVLVAPVSEARTRIYVNLTPPRAVVERRVVAPGPGYIWQDGYQQWNGNSYVWVAGRWVRPPHRHARWTAGRWVHNSHGYYWQEGRWR